MLTNPQSDAAWHGKAVLWPEGGQGGREGTACLGDVSVNGDIGAREGD